MWVTGIIVRNPAEVIAMQPAYCANQPIAVARIKERVVRVIARLLLVRALVISTFAINRTGSPATVFGIEFRNPVAMRPDLSDMCP